MSRANITKGKKTATLIFLFMKDFPLLLSQGKIPEMKTVASEIQNIISVTKVNTGQWW